MIFSSASNRPGAETPETAPSVAPSAPAAVVTSESEPIPASAQPEPIDDDEVKIEQAQRSGIARPWRPSFGALLWSGLGGLVSHAYRCYG